MTTEINIPESSTGVNYFGYLGGQGAGEYFVQTFKAIGNLLSSVSFYAKANFASDLIVAGISFIVNGRTQLNGTGNQLSPTISYDNTYDGNNLARYTISFSDSEALIPNGWPVTPGKEYGLVFSTNWLSQNSRIIFGWNHDNVYNDGEFAYGNYKNGIPTLTYAGGDLALDLVFDAPPCYCSGTLILTDEGEVPVEALKVGDLVITAEGECRPVAWIGHRSLDITRHPDPAAVWPVRVMAGAFAENLPARDLWISPRHAVFVDEVLIPIVRLENGTTITQVPRPRVTYWHVELATHDILVAEGLPAESYLDCGNRTAFANGGAFVELYPDFAPKTLAETYAPLKESGAEVAAVKRRLLDRAEFLGFGTTEDPALHILADGVTILPKDLGGGRFAFELPETSGDIRLVSRLWCPAHLDPVSGDRRFLGVLVTRLEIDGRLHDLAALGEGWLEVDGEPGSRCRWTAGPAALPSGGRQVMVRIGGKPRYWTAPAQDDRSGRGRCAA